MMYQFQRFFFFHTKVVCFVFGVRLVRAKMGKLTSPGKKNFFPKDKNKNSQNLKLQICSIAVKKKIILPERNLTNVLCKL